LAVRKELLADAFDDHGAPGVFQMRTALGSALRLRCFTVAALPPKNQQSSS
jgi:hypothetical protein